MELLQTLQSSLDGLEVGHHTAQPTCVYIVSAGTGRFFLYGITSLLLGTDEQNALALSGQITNEHVSFLKLLYGLLQVDNVDAVSFGENVRSHFRVPSSCLVTKVYASFKKLLH